jgi:hypothetical protein
MRATVAVQRFAAPPVNSMHPARIANGAFWTWMWLSGALVGGRLLDLNPNFADLPRLVGNALIPAVLGVMVDRVIAAKLKRSGSIGSFLVHLNGPKQRMTAAEVRGLAGLIGGLLIAAGALVGIGMVAWQAYWYLRDGLWEALSLITALQWLGVRWASAPMGWYGLHKVLDAVPLSIASALAGFALGAAAVAIGEGLAAPVRPEQ